VLVVVDAVIRVVETAAAQQLAPATRAPFEVAAEVVHAAAFRPATTAAIAAVPAPHKRRAMNDQFRPRAAFGGRHHQAAVDACAHRLMMQRGCDTDSLVLYALRRRSRSGEGKLGRRSDPQDHGMCRPEMARATTNRWISEVPSKIV
jgi:hypothetical protein